MKSNRWGEDIILDTMQSNAILEILTAGITNPNPKYKMLQNISSSDLDYDYYNFEYVLSGSGYIETPEQTYSIHAGDFYFLNKLQYHIYYPDAQNPFRKEFIVVRGALADKLAELFLIRESVIVKRVDMHPLFEKIFENLQTSDKIPNKLLELQIFQLFQAISLLDEKKTAAERDVAREISNYLVSHLQENLTVAKIANDLCMSESSVNHIFIKKYGCSVMQFYIRKKISYAKILLRKTNDSIKKIAEYLAFNDEKYFSKCFKLHTNETPSHYRKRHREKEGT